MNGEILSGAAIGAIGGAAVDYYSARLFALKNSQASNPEHEPLEGEIVELPPMESETFVVRSRNKAFEYASVLVCAGAIAGGSIGCLMSPSPRAHEEVHTKIGLVADNSGRALDNFKGEPADLTIYKYFSELSNSDNLRVSPFLTSQGQDQPTTTKKYLESIPLGGAALDTGINDTLTGNKAVIILSADSPIGVSSETSSISNVVASAQASNERVFVLNVDVGAKNNATDTQLNDLANETDGKYYEATSTNPEEFVKDIEKYILPSESEISTHVDSDKSPYVLFLVLSAAGLVLGAAQRGKYAIRRTFKGNRSK
jgi:hypothetical protein